jgi:hypothetical protein
MAVWRSITMPPNGLCVPWLSDAIILAIELCKVDLLDGFGVKNKPTLQAAS